MRKMVFPLTFGIHHPLCACGCDALADERYPSGFAPICEKQTQGVPAKRTGPCPVVPERGHRMRKAGVSAAGGADNGTPGAVQSGFDGPPQYTLLIHISKNLSSNE